MGNNALTEIKARKPPLYSPPTLGGDKNLNIKELTPHPSEGGGRGDVGRGSGISPIFEDIAALFFFKALSFGEGLGGVRGIELLFAPIAAMFCFIAALVEVNAALFQIIVLMFEVIAALFEAIAAMFCFIDALF